MTTLIHQLAALVSFAATAYVACAYVLRFIMILMAAREGRLQRRYRFMEVRGSAVASDALPRITVIVPAYNEEASIARTVQSLLQGSYPSVDIVVVSDGSTDRTLGILLDEFDLVPEEVPIEAAIATQTVRSLFSSRIEPRLRVIDKRNGGKADALNVGINYSTGELVCVLDADVILDRHALYYLALPFMESPTTVASSGTIRLHNGCVMTATGASELRIPGRWVERFQVSEYALAFGVGRLCFNAGSTHVVISGAFGLFRRSLLLAMGGYHPNAIGEDMELVVRMHRHLREEGVSYRIVYVGDAVCYTEGPSSFQELGKQRTRWHQGLLTTLRLHRGMFGRGRYGAVGLAILPYFVLFELLSPIIELAGWATILLGWPMSLIRGTDALTFIAVASGLCATAGAAGIFIDDIHSRYYPHTRQVLAVAAWSLLEQFGYHQAMLYFRLRAFPRFYGNVHLKGGWVSPTRRVTGFDTKPPVKGIQQ